MKRIFFLAVLVAGAAVAFTGCKTASGYKQADKTGAGISGYRDEVINVQSAVAESLTALDQLLAQANTDPRKPFEAFSRSVANVESAAKKAKSRADTMRARGKAYFDEWQKQLTTVSNEEIRALAEKRRAELEKTFASINDVMQDAKAKFDPFLNDLKDLRTFLSADLTIAGMDAAKTIVEKTRKDGVELKSAIDQAVTELNKIAAILTPAKLQEGSAAGAAPAPAPAK